MFGVSSFRGVVGGWRVITSTALPSTAATNSSGSVMSRRCFAAAATRRKPMVLSSKVTIPRDAKPPPKIKRKIWPVLDMVTGFGDNPKLTTPNNLDKMIEKVETTDVMHCIARLRTKKYAADTLRKDLYIPGCITGFNPAIYGFTELLIGVKFGDMERQLHRRQGSFENTLYELQLADGRKFSVVVGQYAPDQMTDRPQTISFKLYDPDRGANVYMPFYFLDEELCPALKRGGRINRYVWGYKCHVRGPKIPNSLHFTVKGLEVKDRINFYDCLNNKEGLIKVLDRVKDKDPNPMVATIHGKPLDVEKEVDNLDDLFDI